MFDKNDSALLEARVIIKVIICLCAVAFLVVGIVLAVLVNGLYCLFALVGWFICWIAWVFAKILLSYLCDIKLIRNKLYEQSNDVLEVFYETHKVTQSASKELGNEPKTAANTDLASIKQLYDSGLINEEQYKIWKNEIENGE